MVMGMIPKGTRRVSGRNLKFVGVTFSGRNFEKNIISGSGGWDMQPVVMKIGGLVELVGESDLNGISWLCL